MSQNLTVEEMAEVFDLPVQWAQMHVGEHRCVDNRLYRYSCLVADPTTTHVAKTYLRMIEERANAVQQEGSG